MLVVDGDVCAYGASGTAYTDASSTKRMLACILTSVRVLFRFGSPLSNDVDSGASALLLAIKIFGWLLLAALFSSVSHLITTYDLRKRNRREKIDNVLASLSHTQPLIKNIIMEYYKLIGNVTGSTELLSVDQICKDLNPHLALKVAQAVATSLRQKIQVFADADYDIKFITSLLTKHLKLLLVPARTILFHQGDDPDNMYYIVSGQVEVSCGPNVKFFVEAGEFFGEIALYKDIKRTATCVASQDCRLYYLEKGEGFDSVANNKDYPDAHVYFTNIIERRYDQLKSKTVDLPRDSMPDMSMESDQTEEYRSVGSSRRGGGRRSGTRNPLVAADRLSDSVTTFTESAVSGSTLV